MLEYDFENSIGYAICTTSHAMRRALQSKLSQVGMTLRQWEVLACLACEESFSQAEMADYLGIEPPTLAGVLRRMERDGWLERTACSDDRRRNRITPTPQAEAVWKRCTEMCHEIRQQATTGLSDAQIDAFKSTCQQIRLNLAAAGHSGVMAPCLDLPANRERPEFTADATEPEPALI
ncbi:MAG: MarR family transcriptional regulator [Planctomycetaceae bacterium]|nr:MarR family transcriptional regulator [Planctomycetaceae bacterium]